jgi:hypothetical protein
MTVRATSVYEAVFAYYAEQACGHHRIFQSWRETPRSKFASATGAFFRLHEEE